MSIELSKINKCFGTFAAVRDVSLDIPSGQLVALLGPSGSGKTTLLRIIAGLETPSSGEIRLRGRLMNEVRPWERDTPLVWQSLALFPFLTVVRNVEFGLKMRGVDAAEKKGAEDVEASTAFRTVAAKLLPDLFPDE